MERIRARLGCARMDLEAAQESGKEAHAAVSRTQTDGVLELLRREVFTGEQKVAISSRVLRLQWHGDDAARTLEMMSPDLGIAGAIRKRTAGI